MTTNRSSFPKIVFHVGGPAFHPVAEQAAAISRWLGDGYACSLYDGIDAFEALDDADLLVVMGLHWTGMLNGDGSMPPYRPMGEKHREAFERYVASGRPLLIHHGGIASYDDWPRFGDLLGFTWVWDVTQHSPIGDYRVRPRPTGHPLVAGVDEFPIHDELYYDIRITPGLTPTVHAVADYDGRELPMVMSAEGGRVAGAGRTVYLANGHDMRAFESPAMRRLWINAVQWLLDGC
ncbi:MAG: ThuA domain-containing protein [Candidatus Sumerlaeaceae bacterium]|nr:ThuA domain-containing protein [Candidatus Sumerlaeaceae bacterium]